MPALPLPHLAVLLELDLTQPPVTVDPNDPLGRLAARSRPQLAPILRTLHEAGSDRHVAGLIAKVGGSLPWAMAAELRLGLVAFAASGKPTLAWAEDLGSGTGATAALTLGSALDHIWLQPGGAVGPLGVAMETTFVRGALDRLRIQPQLGQRHEYKNAADVLTRAGYTDAHREAVDQIVRSVFDDAVAAIFAGPRTPGRAGSANSSMPDRWARGRRWTPASSMRWGTGTRPTTPSASGSATRSNSCSPSGGARAAARPHSRIAPAGTWPSWTCGARSRPGRSHVSPWGRIAGSDTIGASLRAAARSDQVGAVLMRVDSPGGSAIASEAIWREVARTRESGTPVVVSMGELAASGGYYVACPADVIVALPSTLTGSIGVLGGKLVVSGLLDQLGLTTDRVRYGEHALMGSAREGFTEAERDLLDEELDRIYSDFVGEGRGGTAAVHRAGRGRRPGEGVDRLRCAANGPGGRAWQPATGLPGRPGARRASAVGATASGPARPDPAAIGSTPEQRRPACHRTIRVALPRRRGDGVRTHQRTDRCPQRSAARPPAFTVVRTPAVNSGFKPVFQPERAGKRLFCGIPGRRGGVDDGPVRDGTVRARRQRGGPGQVWGSGSSVGQGG